MLPPSLLQKRCDCVSHTHIETYSHHAVMTVARPQLYAARPQPRDNASAISKPRADPETVGPKIKDPAHGGRTNQNAWAAPGDRGRRETLTEGNANKGRRKKKAFIAPRPLAGGLPLAGQTATLPAAGPSLCSSLPPLFWPLSLGSRDFAAFTPTPTPTPSLV